jgi:hypothetical protein
MSEITYSERRDSGESASGSPRAMLSRITLEAFISWAEELGALSSLPAT